MWPAVVVFGILVVRSEAGGVIPAPARLATTHLAGARHAMTAYQDSTSPVVYVELSRYPGYRFGDDGSVWSCRSRRYRDRFRPDWHQLRPQQTSKSGYRQVALHIDGVQKGHHVHRLILEAFIGPCPEGLQVCHNDGDPSNNRLDNLRYDTCKGNEADKARHGTRMMGSRHHQAKLTEADIPLIRQLRREGWSWTRLATRFGVSTYPIRMIVKGDTWSHIQ